MDRKRLSQNWSKNEGTTSASSTIRVSTPSLYFALAEGVVVEHGLVRGTVTITGGNGESQIHLWDIELVHQNNHWKVWTVRTTPEEPET